MTEKNEITWKFIFLMALLAFMFFAGVIVEKIRMDTPEYFLVVETNHGMLITGIESVISIENSAAGDIAFVLLDEIGKQVEYRFRIDEIRSWSLEPEEGKEK